MTRLIMLGMLGYSAWGLINVPNEPAYWVVAGLAGVVWSQCGEVSRLKKPAADLEEMRKAVDVQASSMDLVAIRLQSIATSLAQREAILRMAVSRIPSDVLKSVDIPMSPCRKCGAFTTHLTEHGWECEKVCHPI